MLLLMVLLRILIAEEPGSSVVFHLANLVCVCLLSFAGLRSYGDLPPGLSGPRLSLHRYVPSHAFLFSCSLFQGANVYDPWASHLYIGPKGVRRNQQFSRVTRNFWCPFAKWHQLHFKTNAFCQWSEGMNNLDMLSELARYLLLLLTGMGLQKRSRRSM